MNTNQGDSGEVDKSQKQVSMPKLNAPTDRSRWHLGIYANSDDPRDRSKKWWKRINSELWQCATVAHASLCISSYSSSNPDSITLDSITPSLISSRSAAYSYIQLIVFCERLSNTYAGSIRSETFYFHLEKIFGIYMHQK